MKPTITAVILTKNEEKMIANCLETLQWCDEVVVVDTGSDDNTLTILEKLKVKVLTTNERSFAAIRNLPLSVIKTEWIFYIDADERVTPQLSKEILVQIETTTANALTMERQNMTYGKVFYHGGWRENVTRIFRKSAFQGWSGDIHESPVFEGSTFLLHTPLLHLMHRSTIEGLRKTVSWTPIEAKLFIDANVAPVKISTILRKGIMEFVRRAILKNGMKDGTEGWIEAIIQGINRMLVYIQIWEMQQKPSIAEKYEEKELEIANLWKKEK